MRALSHVWAAAPVFSIDVLLLSLPLLLLLLLLCVPAAVARLRLAVPARLVAMVGDAGRAEGERQGRGMM